MTIDAKRLQARLGVTQDGQIGRGTFGALFRKFGAKDDVATELALSANVHFPAYGIMDNPLRLAHMMAQLAHESGNFVYMQEIWGPTTAQIRYEGRADLGNNVAGDGKRFMGRGPIQLTGRTNYREYGQALGIDFERHPEIVSYPSIGLHASCEFWMRRGLNALADADDVEAITRRINGGVNGLADRKAQLVKAKGLLL